jgi:hypothetical protein
MLLGFKDIYLHHPFIQLFQLKTCVGYVLKLHFELKWAFDGLIIQNHGG